MREGEPGDRFYVVLSGMLNVSQEGLGERRLLRPGDSFGEVALAMGIPRTASVRAVTPAVVASCDQADVRRAAAAALRRRVNVLLLHAASPTAACGRRRSRRSRRRVTACPRPISPATARPPLEPGTIDYVDHVAGLLDGPAAVVGASFGGLVALELAVGRPELVERLVLVGSSIGGWEWSEAAQAGFAEEEAALERGDLAGAAAQQARMWLADGADPAVRELTEAMTLRTYELQLPLEDDVRGVVAGARAAERLGEIDVPTLVVVGAEDVDDIEAIARKLAAEIPGARLETIAGAGHLPSLERPDELNRLLLDFLR